MDTLLLLPVPALALVPLYVLFPVVLTLIPRDQHHGLVYRIFKLLSFFSIIPSYLMYPNVLRLKSRSWLAEKKKT